MPSEYLRKTVSLSDIDSGIETFRITTNCRIDDLASVMKRVGLTHPPILKSAAQGHMIVCGFRRINAARSLEWPSISAFVLPEDATSLSCALLSISENGIERSLNLIETSRALFLLSSLISENEELLKTAEKIGLPGNPALFKKLLPLCKLPQPLQEGILSGALALPSAQMLFRFPQKTSIALAGFITSLKLSLHKQRELIDIIYEISKIEERSIEAVLNSPDICRILDDPKTDIPRKAALVREYLKKRRFPHITRSMTEFESLSNRLKLGEHVSLKPPPGFESNRYNISLSFGSLPEFELQIKTLEQLSNQEEFRFLLSSRDAHRD